MSGNVKFDAVAPAVATRPDNKSKLILPHDFILSLHGRRVIVFLSYKDHELEGVLSAVDADKGDVFLEEVVHYAWSHSSAGNVKDGTREVLRRSSSAMVNSRYIEIVSLA